MLVFPAMGESSPKQEQAAVLALAPGVLGPDQAEVLAGWRHGDDDDGLAVGVGFLGGPCQVLCGVLGAEPRARSPRCRSHGRRAPVTLRQAPSISHAKAALNFLKCRSRM